MSKKKVFWGAFGVLVIALVVTLSIAANKEVEAPKITLNGIEVLVDIAELDGETVINPKAIVNAIGGSFNQREYKGRWIFEATKGDVDLHFIEGSNVHTLNNKPINMKGLAGFSKDKVFIKSSVLEDFFKLEVDVDKENNIININNNQNDIDIWRGEFAESIVDNIDNARHLITVEGLNVVDIHNQEIILFLNQVPQGADMGLTINGQLLHPNRIENTKKLVEDVLKIISPSSYEDINNAIKYNELDPEYTASGSTDNLNWTVSNTNNNIYISFSKIGGE